MKNKILQMLSNGNFVSGELLADHLGVTRAAVWKQINSLRALGYGIESVKNKGYRLIYRPDVPIPEEILDGLDTEVVGSEIAYFKSVSSTNVFARKLVKNGAEEGTVVVAGVQHSGRGRKNRVWFSSEGGLWFSVILYPNIPPQRSMMLTMAVSISVVEAIKEISGLNSVIKWPNDVLINKRKVCGILTELDAEMDQINYSIVGIGVNVNNKLDESLYGKATTLMMEFGSQVSRVKLLRSILKSLDKYYKKLLDSDYGFIRDKWISMSNIINRKVLVRDDETSIIGVVSKVDEDGFLVLDTEDGSVKILSGDLDYL